MIKYIIDYSLDLFDTSQYCSLEGGMLVPTITPESNADNGDFYQSGPQKSFENLRSSQINHNNLYGHEFLEFEKIDMNRSHDTNSTCNFNLPEHTLAQNTNQLNNNLFTSWKTSSSSLNHKSQPQIDLNSGLPRKICSNCGSISTPSWRRCPEGRNLLCNACGLYQKLHNRPRPLRIREDGSVQVIRNINSSNKNVCHNCRTMETPIWRRSQSGHLLCNACALYLKNHNSSRPSNINYNDSEFNLLT